MKLAEIIAMIEQKNIELKDCYTALSRYHNINEVKLAESISVIDYVITELKDHPKLIKEMKGDNQEDRVTWR